MISIILNDIQIEVASAIAAHGGMKSRHEAYAVIAEEFDEFWDEVKKNPAKMDAEARAAWKKAMHKELVQTAAMCVQAVYDLNLTPETLNPKGPTHF